MSYGIVLGGSSHYSDSIFKIKRIIIIITNTGRHDMIYLLIAIGLTPGGISSVHIYAQTIHRTTQNELYMDKHNNFGRVRAVPPLG
jgi:hypothetical protein